MRIFAALMGVVFSATAAAAESTGSSLIFPYLEGKDYVVLDTPVPTSSPNKIEVVEVFSYLCSHCYHFDPILSAWMKQQKPDVALVQVHASWSPAMEPYQRGFYVAQALKVKDKAHAAIFSAIHKDQKELKDAQAWADFLSVYGANKQAVITAYNSDAITKQLAQANQLFRSYQISGTPELVVEGKYRISTRFVGTQEDMLKVVQYLVNKARAERGAK
ncbi:thiol:disulfide interchange protein DsbA [Cellvibrio zantedeschiae]|uniref:Thiol:disulfide interchange protein n=1 Tax=Cellvibrio zantedeschiae TaxID=1237077 RepID=A0ABQ3BA97_9GAMM|nr:thiol:disulfide interchange protein DsbA/DsbL [Cellvibrio zantedeschiae]GGY85868.1 thiol:disulfide interchange protein DsbA [Cellvibrio zantedeschiae]